MLRLFQAGVLLFGIGLGSTGRAADPADAPPTSPDPEPVVEVQPAPSPSPERQPASDRTRGATPAPTTGFDQFRLIAQRNIFDPDRRPAAARAAEPPRREERPVRSDTIAVTGTIVYDDKAFAFVSSPQPEYRGVFSPGDRVGGLPLVAIDSHGITLEGPDAPLRVPVGQGLRRTGDRPWEISAVTSEALASSSISERPGRGGPGSPNAGPPARPGTAAAAPAGTGAGGDVSDIMRRLMERRRAQTE